MGLTGNSSGIKSIDKKGIGIKRKPNQKVIAIAGNPNVGKSTVFNALTGMHQHTGNWPGKTVSNAQGSLKTKKNSFIFVDIPGTYSLNPHSAEEQVASDYIYSNSSDAVMVVCDASALERTLGLALKIGECCKNVIVCVNLLDEARLKGISVDLQRLSLELGMEVIGIVAHEKKSIKRLIAFLDNFFKREREYARKNINYGEQIEALITDIEQQLTLQAFKQNTRFLAVKILEGDKDFIEKNQLSQIYEANQMYIQMKGLDSEKIGYKITAAAVNRAREITAVCTKKTAAKRGNRDMLLDRILTGRYTAIPIMLCLLAFIFWLTIVGANFLSSYLSSFMAFLENKLLNFFTHTGTNAWIYEPIVFGGFRVLGWVVSVMLPPMAIFFPFFTLLEDSGYLVRIAYNFDRPFYKCGACGKQALTMCMGFGCNAVGVSGARIIDSKRERLLAVLTNAFMPCNGRFPMLITFIAIFIVGANSTLGSVAAASVLCMVIFLAILLSLLITKLLSKTLLKGIPSSYILELPSYRKPQFARVIVRSLFDRTLFVLGRAVCVAIPAGFVIWGLSNITIENQSLLLICSNFLKPFGSLLGLDGAILLAFILGTPANEIVVPIMLMIYMGNSRLTEISDNNLIKEILMLNGWDIKTAICVIIFTVFHWPCATTLLSIKKETGSIKWAFASAIIPTFIGMLFCIIINILFKLFV